MDETPERIRQEMIAGARARIRFALDTHHRDEMQIFQMFGKQIEVKSVDDEHVTLKVTAASKTITIKDPISGFPSDTLLTQLMMVLQ